MHPETGQYAFRVRTTNHAVSQGHTEGAEVNVSNKHHTVVFEDLTPPNPEVHPSRDEALRTGWKNFSSVTRDI